MAPLQEFDVQCPRCDAVYQVPPAMAGTEVRCSVCQTTFQIGNPPEPQPLPVSLPLPLPLPLPLSPPPPAHGPGPGVGNVPSSVPMPHPSTVLFSEPPVTPAGPMMDGPDFHYEVPAGKRRGMGGLKSLLLIGSGALLVFCLASVKRQKRPAINPAGSGPGHGAEASTAQVPASRAPQSASAFPSIDANKRPAASPAPPAPTSLTPEPEMGTDLTLASPPSSSIQGADSEIRRAILPPDPAESAPAALPTAEPGNTPVMAVAGSPSATPPPAAAAAAAAAAPAATTVAAPAPPRQVDTAALREKSRLSLEKFLLAPDLATRLSVSQHPEKVKAEMEAYYQKTPVAPVPMEAVTFLTETALPDSDYKFHLYNVAIKGEDAPIPFAVEETADGFRVDWQTFVESHDHKLRNFFATPTETPGQFRVLLRRAHYFGPAVPGQDKVRVAYSLEPPTRDETFYGWADLESLIYRQKLATGERAGWEAQSYVIVELAWRGNQETGRWVALQRIISDSWRLD